MVVDILPTLQQAAGPNPIRISSASLLDGQSLLPVLMNEGEFLTKKRVGFFNFAARELAVIDFPWKLISTTTKDYLFNLQVDPFEQENLSDYEPEKLLKMKQLRDQYLTN